MSRQRSGAKVGLLIVTALLLMWFLALAAHCLQCPPHPGPFGTQALTPDGSHLICNVDAAVPGKYELYAVDGVRDPWRLSPGMADDRDVISFVVSPDGAKVALACDRLTWTEYDLWVAPVAGGAATQVSQHNLPSEHDVDDYVWASDRVVWRQGRNTVGLWDLYSATTQGQGRTKLSSFGTVQRGHRALAGERVRFSADPEGMGAFRWYVVGAAGGRVWQELFADGFESGVVTRWQ